MLLGQGLHVLAVDYRSFGDSSRVSLTEQVGSCLDIKTIVSYERKSVKNNNLGDSIRAPLSITQLFVYV